MSRRTAILEKASLNLSAEEQRFVRVAAPAGWSIQETDRGPAYRTRDGMRVLISEDRRGPGRAWHVSVSRRERDPSRADLDNVIRTFVPHAAGAAALSASVATPYLVHLTIPLDAAAANDFEATAAAHPLAFIDTTTRADDLLALAALTIPGDGGWWLATLGAYTVAVAAAKARGAEPLSEARRMISALGGCMERFGGAPNFPEAVRYVGRKYHTMLVKTDPDVAWPPKSLAHAEFECARYLLLVASGAREHVGRVAEAAAVLVARPALDPAGVEDALDDAMVALGTQVRDVFRAAKRRDAERAAKRGRA